MVSASACQPEGRGFEAGPRQLVQSQAIIHRLALKGMVGQAARWRHLDYGTIYWVNLPVEARVG